MRTLSGSITFNGAEGTYRILLSADRYERLLRVRGIELYDAFDGTQFWQSDFGSPLYRRPAPFSVEEGQGWLSVLTAFSESETGERFVRSMNGGTDVTLRESSMLALTDGDNRYEYGAPTIETAALTSL